MTTFYGGVSGANAWRTVIAFVDILPAFCLLGSILPLFYDFWAVRGANPSISLSLLTVMALGKKDYISHFPSFSAGLHQYTQYIFISIAVLTEFDSDFCGIF